MKVTVIGTGYVGLVSGACFADMGHDVTCVDIDQKKIDLLNDLIPPIYEPGLKELLERNVRAGRLHFSTNYDSVQNSTLTFLAVGTPSAEDGRANLSYLYEAARQVVAQLPAQGGVMVIKSTVPVGTAHALTRFCQECAPTKQFTVVNNPEFLKEGSAIDDFMRPDRVIVGHQDPNVGALMDELYEPLVRQGNPIFHMSNLSAEMSKYAANCFLATKISFINEIARLCDATGADIDEVRRGITSDKRIGPHFLYPGPGYGGSCFPKDVLALLATAQDHAQELNVVRAAHDVNRAQKRYLTQKLLNHFQGQLKGRVIALWGVAFKPNTDDIRESAAISLVEELVTAGAHVRFYDPVAAPNFSAHMTHTANALECCQSKYDCLNQADALVVLTDWAEFKGPDFNEIKLRLREAVLFDGRNLYNTEKIRQHGITYYAIGKRIAHA